MHFAGFINAATQLEILSHGCPSLEAVNSGQRWNGSIRFQFKASSRHVRSKIVLRSWQASMHDTQLFGPSNGLPRGCDVLHNELPFGM